MSAIAETLRRLGLEEHEVKTYLALLDLGESTATKLAERTGLGRVHMYQIVNKLMDKGLASYVIKNNVKYFLAADQETLLKEIQDKEKELQTILPELKARQKEMVPDIKVEVYRGYEGFKTVLNDRIRTGGDMYSFGVEEKKFKEYFGPLMDQFFRREREKKLKEFILTHKKTKFTYNQDNISYRFISKKYFDPTPTAIYKDRILFIVWEPLTIILIKNSGLAEAHRKHFKLLWDLAKTK